MTIQESEPRTDFNLFHWCFIFFDIISYYCYFLQNVLFCKEYVLVHLSFSFFRSVTVPLLAFSIKVVELHCSSSDALLVDDGEEKLETFVSDLFNKLKFFPITFCWRYSNFALHQIFSIVTTRCFFSLFTVGIEITFFFYLT